VKYLAVIAIALLSGCWDDGYRWATDDQIVEAAKRCGIPNLVPTKAGGAWAAYVDEAVPDHMAKEDCIYADLKRQGLNVTR